MSFNPRGFKNSWGKSGLFTFRSRYINEVDKEFQEGQEQQRTYKKKSPPKKQIIQDISSVISFILVILFLIWIL